MNDKELKEFYTPERMNQVALMMSQIIRLLGANGAYLQVNGNEFNLILDKDEILKVLREDPADTSEPQQPQFENIDKW